MLRKGRIAVACLAVATTAYWSFAATNWQLQTKVSTAGGTITVRDHAPQSTGISFNNFTTSNPINVTVTANSGYTIGGITENGSALSVTNPGRQSVSISGRLTAQSLIASFVPNVITFTPSIVGGAATITSPTLPSPPALPNTPAPVNVPYGKDATITVKPTHTYGVITDIKVNGNRIAGVNFPATGSVTFKILAITAAPTVEIDSAEVSVAAGANQLAQPNHQVTLNGNATLLDSGATATWSVVSVPYGSGAALSSTTSLTPTFTPDKPGTYVFQLAAAIGGNVLTSATTTVNVSDAYTSDPTDTLRATCGNCHGNNGVYAAGVFQSWSGNRHRKTADPLPTWSNCTNCHSSMVNGHPTDMTSTQTETLCSQCHTTEGNDFFNVSPHWNNLRNDGDSATAGDKQATCATNSCHFRPLPNTITYVSHGAPGSADGSFKGACAACHSDGGSNNGGDHKVLTGTIHDATTITMQDTCWACHEGSHHGTPTYAYQKSSHYLGHKLVTCQDCHNPHSTKATFSAYDQTSHAKTTAGSCDACHARSAGKPYGIFSSNGTMVQPHTASKNASGNTNAHFAVAGVSYTNRSVFYNISSSYVNKNTTCSDCHGHNNQVNAEYADTLHGNPFSRWKGKQMFKYAGYSAASANVYTPSNSVNDGCVRCHTATGFVNFVQSGFKDLRAWGFADTTDKTTELISCNACHNTTKGAIAGEADVALPEGPLNITGAYDSSSVRMSKTAFPAYYNYSSQLTGKYINGVKAASSAVPVQFRDFKNSNVCVPCHSGRSGNSTNGDVIKALASFDGFTTLGATGGAVPGAPHGVYQASLLDAKIGYQFTKYTSAANGHASIGVGGVVVTNTVSGPCVTCHMPDVADATGATTSHKRHNFEIKNSDGSLPVVCSKCHSTSFTGADLDAAKVNFQAAVSALGEILATPSLNQYNAAVVRYVVGKGYVSANLADDNKTVVSSRLVPQTLTSKDNAILVGSVYNLNLLYNLAYGGSDAGAYAHNPQYLKQLINDTINAVRNTTSTGSVADAISQIPTVAVAGQTAGFSADQVAAATTALNNANNHYAAGAYKVQYMAGAATCTTCHNPNESTIQAEARVAWSESDHGLTTGAAWMPSGSHAWRNAGDPADFSKAIPVNDCQRCHTADGFAQFADSKFTNIAAVATLADAATNSPLNCNACHTNDSFARRAVVSVAGAGDGVSGIGVATFYNISTVDKVTNTTVKARIAANFPDVGDSNMCNSCHSARLSGSALVTAVKNGLSLSNSGFQNSHYMGVAGMMYAKAGFTAFTSASAVIGTSTYGASLTSSIDGGAVTSTHRLLGTAGALGHGITTNTKLNQGGPCVTCHMKGYNSGTSVTDRAGAGHSLQIDQETITQVCNNCHKSEGGTDITNITSFQSAFLEPNAEVFQNSLKLATTLLLQNYNISYNSASYPYFYDESLPLKNGKKQAVTDWTRGAALSNTAALKLEGACFNINLLSREPAAYVHARTYTRRLVYDTIDFLDNGAMDMSVKATALNLSTTAGSPVYGLYTTGPVAYNGGAPYAGGTIDAGTTESATFLFGWSGTGAWSTPERP